MIPKDKEVKYTSTMKIIACCLIVVVCFSEGVLSLTCPLGSTEVKGYCFIASKQTAKYHHAQMYCLSYGCKVAVPDTAKVSAIQEFGQTNSLSTVVFGITDVLQEGTFVSAPSGVEFTDLVWASGKPSGSTNNNCVRVDTLSTWEMKDVSCTGKNMFICECDSV